MEQQAEFTPKRKIKMKQLLFILVASSLISFKSNAQGCIDTVHVKGYYIIKKIKSQIGTSKVIQKNKTTRVLQNTVDTHYDPSFIPYDSISQGHPLSYWLNHFFDDTKQVFISCEKFSVKDFVDKKCLHELKNNDDRCLFPALKSGVLYATTNLNTGDVFEIYFLDAYWAKAKVKAGSLEADLIPSKIAQRSISPSAKEFDLYCFVRCDSIRMNPKIKDPHIKVWKK